MMTIKKCAHCGGEAQLKQDDEYMPWFRVICLNERCGMRTTFCSTGEMAINIWNNRYIEQAQNERVKYALMRIKENGFEARCVNDEQGLIHCYDREGELVCYYANTGTIQGSDKKGIIRLLDRLRGYGV